MMPASPKHLVILSGGIDSATILAAKVREHGKDGVAAINFYYGQRHQKEMEAAERLSDFYETGLLQVDLRGTFVAIKGNALTDPDHAVPHGHYADDSMRQTVVPFRNLVFIASAAAYAASVDMTHVYLGAHTGDHPVYPDCRPEFVAAVAAALGMGHYHPIALEAPFIDKNKAEIVELGLELGVPYHLTWTCYQGKPRPCGKCGACVERVEAFASNGCKDPLLDR